MFFDELNLNDNILDALYDMRFDECTPIQEACIPAILNKKDILGFLCSLYSMMEAIQKTKSIAL